MMVKLLVVMWVTLVVFLVFVEVMSVVLAWLLPFSQALIKASWVITSGLGPFS